MVAKLASHGTITRYNQGCHKACCRRANSDRVAANRQFRALNPIVPGDYVDAQPARQHVWELRAPREQGQRMSLYAIADRAGVDYKFIYRLLFGQDGGEPTKTIEAETDSRIRLVGFEAGFYGATSIRRRVGAMYWLGMPINRIATEAKVSRARLLDILAGRQHELGAEMYYRIVAYYCQYWLAPPRVSLKQLQTMRETAKARGYYPPGAWYDIDDPHAQPDPSVCWYI
jgi:putative component of toxin-antitoxin plasmid stabilization module